MWFQKKEKKTRAKKMEVQGDKYQAKKQWKKAYGAYQSSQKLNPDNPAIYDKLLHTKGQLQKEWTEEDFSESLEWTMKKQELENPKLKEVHEALNPEYQEVWRLIAQLLSAPEEQRFFYIEKIQQYQTKALLPLIHFLISIVHPSKKEEDLEPASPVGC